MFDFGALTPAQQRAAGNVAINLDGGESPRVLARLVELGVVESYPENRGGHPPLTVTRYRMPLAVHLAWCEWCSANLTEEDRGL